MSEMLQLVAALPEVLPAAWCEGNAVATSVMEALSFVTPVLEGFIAGTVAQSVVARAREPARDAELREFVREEARHSRVHRAFNARLERGLGGVPPALRAVRASLLAIRRHLPQRARLLLAAALEHFAAVASQAYLARESQWRFASMQARALFVQHAREELAHRAVVYDACSEEGPPPRSWRALAILSVLFGALAYGAVTVPWIVHRKTGRRLGSTLAALAAFARHRRGSVLSFCRLRELLSFARADFHPGLDKP
jgi:predicted metal-dependent hydrolase